MRQAIACAIDRGLIIRTLLSRPCATCGEPVAGKPLGVDGRRGALRLRSGARGAVARRGGIRRRSDGMRLHLTMKTSTDEEHGCWLPCCSSNWRRVGIALDLRSYEFATFYADVTRGAFQMYSLCWIGGNEQPDIFSYVFSSARFPPKGANRGHYSNPQLDALLDDAAQSTDQARRRADYVEAQQILARDLPGFNLWYLDTLVVHNKRLINVEPSPSGSYTFLETAELDGQLKSRIDAKSLRGVRCIAFCACESLLP